MANKDFKVKNGIDIQSPLPVAMGGTGQTSTTNTLNSLLPAQASASGKYLTSDGTNVSWATVSLAYSGVTSQSISSNLILTAFNKYFVDTSASRTLTLPASPAVGDEIYIYDASGTAATYNITVSRNSNYINGATSNLIIDVNGGSAALTYTGGTYGWKVG